MEAASEKKWFVYMGDQHEGPFSLNEIQEKMNSGVVTHHHYVWAEGMADWVPMPQAPAFDELVKDAIAKATAATAPKSEAISVKIEPAGASVAPSVSNEAPSAVSAVQENTSGSGPKVVSPNVIQLSTADRQSSAPLMDAPRPSSSSSKLESELAETPKRRSGKPVVFLVLLLVVAGGGAFAFKKGLFDKWIGGGASGTAPQAQSGAGAQVAQATGRTFADFVQPKLLVLAEKFPALSKWISPIPRLQDVTQEEYQLLRTAASTPVKEGPAVSLALSTSDLLNPSFYIASNFPDGTKLSVKIDGQGDTLLNQTAFTAVADAVVMKKLAKTLPLKNADGKPLARGSYRVVVTEFAPTNDPGMTSAHPAIPIQAPSGAASAVLTSATAPSGSAAAPSGAAAPAPTANANTTHSADPTNSVSKPAKVLATKIYFLGGLKDASYTERLKEYHDRLAKWAKDDLVELEQFTGTLDAQLARTGQEFTKIRSSVKKGKVTKAHRKAWDKFSAEWGALSRDMSEKFTKWSPETLKNEHFYYALYENLKMAGQAVLTLNSLQSSFFTGDADPNSVDIQVSEAQSYAASQIAALKGRVEKAKSTPATANGMPVREGL